MIKMIKKFIKKSRSNCAAVIVAAGTSSRMQGTDKILYPLGGKPLIVHTISVFQNVAQIKEIVVVTRKELLADMQQLCEKYALSKVTAVVAGGSTRAHSVMKGLDCVSNSADYVAIHDGARPFVTQQIIHETLNKAMEYHAAAPAVPVKDTIKMAHGHIVTHTPDRACLFAVQTPQIFDYDLLRGALVKAIDDAMPITDDCSAVEAMGMSVYLTQGDDENIKVTTPSDLILAKAIWEGRESRCE